MFSHQHGDMTLSQCGEEIRLREAGPGTGCGSSRGPGGQVSMERESGGSALLCVGLGLREET